MRIKKFISNAVLFGIALSSSAALSEIYTGNISCKNTVNDSDIETVVVYLNGINNTLNQAETSRALLEDRLSEICNRSDCIVEKFYNQTDGSLDDVHELNFVGDLERDSANLSLRQLMPHIRAGYLKYRSQLAENGVNVSAFDATDQKALNELEEIAEDAENSSSDPEIEFSEAGGDITQWLINKVSDEADIAIPMSSIVLASMQRRSVFLDATFQSTYKRNLTEIYLSNREFYASDADAEQAVTRTVEGLVTYLEEHMLSGKKVIVVAHSQGNHMIELAYGVLAEKWNESNQGSQIIDAIQVVGVASVASTTPNSTYITWDQDDVVLVVYDKSSDGDPLVANFTAVNANVVEDTNNHNFGNVYLSEQLQGTFTPPVGGNNTGVQDLVSAGENVSVSDWIMGLIDGSIDASVPYENEISSSGFLTASLRWEQYSDMDLWINENDENLVSYKNFTGIYNGGLDRDDRDGEGPEHYVANISCEEAALKNWQFSIHQYRDGGEPAIAYFSVKIGNHVLQQRTYAMDSWPEEVGLAAKVTLGELGNNQVLPYEIDLKEEISD